MPLVYLTRKEHFNAAHKLFNPNWSEEQNAAVFGPCANKNWHGHNYDLRVTVKGEPQAETGFIVDLKALSTVIRRLVIDKLDHKNLNLDVPFLEGKMTSTEVLAVEIWNILAPAVQDLGPCRLHKIELFETERNSVTYYGE